MSCSYCGNEYPICQKYDSFICHDCIESQKEYECKVAGDNDTLCEYAKDCEIYNFTESKTDYNAELIRIKDLLELAVVSRSMMQVQRTIAYIELLIEGDE